MTLTEIIAQAKERFPQLPDATALIYINDAHIELCQSARVYVYESTVTLTAALTYTLTPPTGQLFERTWEARYVDSLGNETPMTSVSIRELDKFRKGWRGSTSTGTPNEYYIDRDASGNLILGLPFAPTAGDTIKLTASMYVPLTTTLPTVLGTGKYYLYAVWERFSEVKEPQLMKEFQEKRITEMVKIQKRLSTFDAETRPRLIPGIGGIGGRV